MKTEYEFLRHEMEENLNKQEILSNIILSMQGLSILGSIITNSQNQNTYALIIVAVMGLSSVLLARIIQARNTVYYLSTYLYYLEEYNPQSHIHWETNLDKFRGEKYGMALNEDLFRGIVIRVAGACKDLGIAMLSIFLFFLLLSVNKQSILLIIVRILGGIVCLINILFTIYILTDGKMRKEYKKRWKEILKDNQQS